MPDKVIVSDKPLVVADRDGTLIEEQEYLSDPARVSLLPGAAQGLKRLKRAGFQVVVVSNQSGVARGLITRDQLHRVNRRFLALLKGKNAAVDGLYWCPHRPSARCACRKPKLGMVKRAAKDLGVAWKGSVSVGDRPSDVRLGQRAGGAGVLVLTGYGRQWTKNRRGFRPDKIVADFGRAAAWIIRRQEGKNS